MDSEPEGMSDGSASLARETRACVRAAGQRGSKKLRVCMTAKQDEDSAADSVLFAHRSSDMTHTECIPPRTVISVGSLRAGCGRPAEGERIDLLHGLHCPVIVGELCVGHVKLGKKCVTEPEAAQ